MVSDVLVYNNDYSTAKNILKTDIVPHFSEVSLRYRVFSMDVSCDSFLSPICMMKFKYSGKKRAYRLGQGDSDSPIFFKIEMIHMSFLNS